MRIVLFFFKRKDLGEEKNGEMGRMEHLADFFLGGLAFFFLLRVGKSLELDMLWF